MTKRKRRERKEYPVIQGNLIEDSTIELCSTNKHKTAFTIAEINTKKEVQCVYWGFLHPISKGQLVIVKGTSKNNCFICFDVKKIDRPYIFD